MAYTEVLNRTDEAAAPDWRAEAMDALERMAASGRPFTAFDLTEDGVTEPDHPNRWGALFRSAYEKGLIVPVGYTRSRREGRNRGVCRVWQGAS